jgi:hypothetical protein
MATGIVAAVALFSMLGTAWADA